MKMTPATKDIIWGGRRLIDSYNKSCGTERLAESWELTVRPDGMSVVANGEYATRTLGEFIDAAGADVIGKGYEGDRFPLLIKLIDARDRLSIQVHPSDEYALKNENEYGKTEMWYIVEADEGAELVFGLSSDYTPEKFKAALDAGRVEDMLHRVKVHAGEVYFIPSGLVHAIGAGILICEIQQNSNVTYRVYDYNRPGADGKPRPLHVNKALDVIVNYTPAEIEALRFSRDVKPRDDSSALLAACDKFVVTRYDICGKVTVDADETSFVSLTFTDGDGVIVFDGCEYEFTKGDTYFLPPEWAGRSYARIAPSRLRQGYEISRLSRIKNRERVYIRSRIFRIVFMATTQGCISARRFNPSCGRASFGRPRRDILFDIAAKSTLFQYDIYV